MPKSFRQHQKVLVESSSVGSTCIGQAPLTLHSDTRSFTWGLCAQENSKGREKINREHVFGSHAPGNANKIANALANLTTTSALRAEEKIIVSVYD